MNKKVFFIGLFLFLLFRIIAQKPFERSLILPGGGLKMAMHMGSYHAMLQSGLEPDLIVGTCGGGLTAAIIEMFPGQPQKQLEYLLSPEVHQGLLKIKTTRHAKLLNVLWLIISSEFQGRKQHYFRKFVLNVPQNLGIFDQIGFSPKSVEKPFATIIQSTELLRKKHYDFSQVFFTDFNTAELLKGFESMLGKNVIKETVVITDFLLKDAVRASITDPFLMSPFKKDERYFMTGAVDVLPFELTETLSTETYFFYKNDLQSLLDRFFKATFGFKMMDKVNRQRDQKSELVIDSIFGTNAEIDPGLVLFAGIITKVPEKYEIYREIMLRQYQISLNRSLEILNQKKTEKNPVK